MNRSGNRIRKWILLGVVGSAVCLGSLLAMAGVRPAAPSPAMTERELAALDPSLADAVRRAMSDADDDGVTMWITSGRRTREEQAELFADAVDEHGSVAEASRWVIPPDGHSAHLDGRAVDIGPKSGAAWLREHGPRYGLCQVYENEPWHFELVAVDGRCPALLPDASRAAASS